MLSLYLAGVAGVLLLILNEASLWAVPGIRHGLRLALVALLMGLWFYTQSLLGARVRRNREIWRRVARPHCDRCIAGPLANPKAADRLLIVSSALVDMLGVFVLLRGVFGTSLRPLIALDIPLRDECAGVPKRLCSLPPPPGIIWRHPGFPSLLVTYKVGNDFFFSGHTAVTALAAAELARLSPVLGAVGAVVVFLEIIVVLALRAHYTMDVFAALLATACSLFIADWICLVLAV